MAGAVDMNQECAQQMFNNGATLVMLNVPPTTEIGIDLTSWNVGEKFNGIKMIPPGLHFVYFSTLSKERQVAPRTGFFHVFEAKEVLVKVFDPQTEDFKDDTEEQCERIKTNLRNLDSSLGPYPFETWKKWISLSQHIVKSHMEQVLPSNGIVEMVSHSDSDWRWRELPRRPFSSESTAAERTLNSLDSSYLFELLLKDSNCSNILSELQLSFVVFIVGQCWTGWERWKQLIDVLCRAENAILQHHQFFSKTLGVMFYQILEVPQDLFVDIVEHQNFLAASLSYLFANINDNSEQLPKTFVEKANKFRDSLVNKFGWSFSLEGNEEDLPVVVEL